MQQRHRLAARSPSTEDEPAVRGDEHPMLELQQQVGNQVVSRLVAAATGPPPPPVQRKEGDWSWLSSTVNFFTGAGDAVQLGAELALDNEVNKKCIRHYRAGTGADLRFTAAEVQTMAVVANVFNFAGVKAAQDTVMKELTKRRQEAEKADPERAQAGFAPRVDTTGLEAPIIDATGHCGTGGLGTATMHVDGKIVYTEQGWSVEGSFWLYDEWDFDLDKWRGAMLTAQTAAGRLFLPGKPFKVYTDAVSFNSSTWSGNVINYGNGRANAATSQR
jgi:hypothetical protein